MATRRPSAMRRYRFARRRPRVARVSGGAPARPAGGAVKPARILHRLRGHEGAALEGLGALVRHRRLLGEDLGGIVLAAVLGLVAEPLGVAVVVPGRAIVRHAVDDLEAQIGMLDADGHELAEIARGDPDREPALVDGALVHVADADAEHAQPVLVGVEAAQRLAEYLGHAVAAIGLDDTRDDRWFRHGDKSPLRGCWWER